MGTETSWYHSASKYTVEFLHLRLGSIDIDGSHLSQFHGLGFLTCQDTRAFLTSATSTSSTKEDQDPQLGQRPRYLGELYPQF